MHSLLLLLCLLLGTCTNSQEGDSASNVTHVSPLCQSHLKGPYTLPGRPGRDGRDGKDGAPRQNGRDGVTGPPGIPGQNGRDGVAGPPGTPGISAIDDFDNDWEIIRLLAKEEVLAGCNCPCAAIPGAFAPPFVGQDFHCESATHYEPETFQWFTNNTLWDGEDCYPGSNCCNNALAPWFRRALQEKTTEDIEVRWCTGQGLTYDRVATELLELYVY